MHVVRSETLQNKQTNKQKPREQNRTVNTPKLKHLETKIELQGSCFPYMLTQWA